MRYRAGYCESRDAVRFLGCRRGIRTGSSVVPRNIHPRTIHDATAAGCRRSAGPGHRRHLLTAARRPHLTGTHPVPHLTDAAKTGTSPSPAGPTRSSARSNPAAARGPRPWTRSARHPGTTPPPPMATALLGEMISEPGAPTQPPGAALHRHAFPGRRHARGGRRLRDRGRRGSARRCRPLPGRCAAADSHHRSAQGEPPLRPTLAARLGRAPRGDAQDDRPPTGRADDLGLRAALPSAVGGYGRYRISSITQPSDVRYGPCGMRGGRAAKCPAEKVSSSVRSCRLPSSR